MRGKKSHFIFYAVITTSWCCKTSCNSFVQVFFPSASSQESLAWKRFNVQPFSFSQFCFFWGWGGGGGNNVKNASSPFIWQGWKSQQQFQNHRVWSDGSRAWPYFFPGAIQSCSSRCHVLYVVNSQLTSWGVATWVVFSNWCDWTSPLRIFTESHHPGDLPLSSLQS